MATPPLRTEVRNGGVLFTYISWHNAPSHQKPFSVLQHLGGLFRLNPVVSSFSIRYSEKGRCPLPATSDSC